MQQIDSLVAAHPAVKSRTSITGYSFMGGQGNSYGTSIIKLKDWSERQGEGLSSDDVVGALTMQTRQLVKDGQVMLFAPPMITGYGASNGFEFNLQDKTGGDLDRFFEVAQQFLGALNQRPEIMYAMTTFNPNFPQYMVDIDAAKCKQAGLSPKDILTTLQGYFGGLYASNFNRFGKLYRVMIQADPEARISPESLNGIMVRNGTEMAPITQFMSLRKVYGPDNINRFNMYTSMKVSGMPKPGVSSGRSDQGDRGGGEPDAPDRLRIRVLEPEPRGAEYGYQHHGHDLLALLGIRLPVAERAVRELYPSAGRDSLDSVRFAGDVHLRADYGRRK